MSEFLLRLPDSRFSKEFLRSARLYSTALELIESRSDIAYQLLISAVETLSGSALKRFKPTEDDQIENKKNVYNTARKLGLSEAASKQLALEAAKSESWIKRKFVSFLMDNCGDELWSEDKVFLAPTRWLPDKEGFESALTQVYQARSSSTHSGERFPATAGLGTGTMLPIEAMREIDSGNPMFPPVTWFERVVQMALIKFITDDLSSPLPIAQNIE